MIQSQHVNCHIFGQTNVAYKPCLYTGMGHLPYPNTFDGDFKENESHLERKQVSRKEKLIREFIFLIFGET